MFNVTGEILQKMAEELVNIFRETTPKNSRYPQTNRCHFEQFKTDVYRVFAEYDNYFTTKCAYKAIVEKAKEMASIWVPYTYNFVESIPNV